MTAEIQVSTSSDLLRLLGMTDEVIPEASCHDTELLEVLRGAAEIRPYIQKRTIFSQMSGRPDRMEVGRIISASPEVQWFVRDKELKNRGAALAVSLACIMFLGQSWLDLLAGLLSLYNLVERLSPDEAELLNRIAEWTIKGRKYDYGISERQLRDSYEEDGAKADTLIHALLDREILRRVDDRLRIVR